MGKRVVGLRGLELALDDLVGHLRERGCGEKQKQDGCSHAPRSVSRTANVIPITKESLREETIESLNQAGARMFCPFCGVKNTTGPTQCFVCGKKLPSLDAEAPVRNPRPPSVPRERPAMPRPAHLGDRLIAVILDSVLLAAILLVAAAAIWWERLLIPPLAVAISG